MKKVLIILLVILAGLLGWYLLSPLFIDKVVDESFPIIETDDNELSGAEESETEDSPQTDNGQEELSQENETEEMAIDTNEHQMTQAQIDTMTEAEKEEMEQKILNEIATQPDKTMEEEMPQFVESQPILLAEGTFSDADSFHQGSGAAKLYSLPEGSHLLRFEEVEFTNGPDLRVYLVQEENPTKEQVKNGVELGELKGNIGNQNYPLPPDLNPSDYKTVVIYCKPFSVIFSTALLQPTPSS